MLDSVFTNSEIRIAVILLLLVVGNMNLQRYFDLS